MRLNSKELKGVVCGMLLGDGFIDKQGGLSFVHSINQSEYAKYKQHILNDNFITKYTEYTCNNYKSGKAYSECKVRCNTTEFTKLCRKLWYTPEKHVNTNILNWLTPLGLAIWYMDDGCLGFLKYSDIERYGDIRSRKGYIHTEGFSYAENELLRDFLAARFGITTRIAKDYKQDRGVTYYKLYMNSTELSKLLNIIGEYIPSCMKYKQCYRFSSSTVKYKQNLCGMPCESTQCPYAIV